VTDGQVFDLLDKWESVLTRLALRGEPLALDEAHDLLAAAVGTARLLRDRAAVDELLVLFDRLLLPAPSRDGHRY